MSKKGLVIYKILSIATLVLPVSVFLILQATIFSIAPDYTIYNAEINDLNVYNLKDEYFIYSTTKTPNFSGYVSYNVELDSYGIVVNEKDIIKVGKTFINYKLEDIKKIETNNKKSWTVPLATFISIGALLIVLLVVKGKMGWAKKYPRVAVMISLTTGTTILFIINTIVVNILNVFLVATVSWGIYLLEYMFVNNKLTERERQKKSSDLTEALKEALK